tara:strand:- start:7094 stop:7330 length:237 start_codon:yes stop_codon:yes gene_type:complete
MMLKEVAEERANRYAEKAGVSLSESDMKHCLSLANRVEIREYVFGLKSKPLPKKEVAPKVEKKSSGGLSGSSKQSKSE